MVDALEGMGYGERRPAPTGARRYLRGWLANRKRTARKKRNLGRSGHRNSAEYHDHRYPGVTLDGMRERAGRLRTQLGRFEGIRIRQIAEHIFRIEA
jgi:hypothetical protein